jgi:hypothetical protein
LKFDFWNFFVLFLLFFALDKPVLGRDGAEEDKKEVAG